MSRSSKVNLSLTIVANLWRTLWLTSWVQPAAVLRQNCMAQSAGSCWGRPRQAAPGISASNARTRSRRTARSSELQVNEPAHDNDASEKEGQCHVALRPRVRKERTNREGPRPDRYEWRLVGAGEQELAWSPPEWGIAD